jgi:hypothetical protein
MVLLAILTGFVAVYIWRRHVSWAELVILCGWGLLAAGTPIGSIPAQWLHDLSAQISQWF